MRFLTIYALMEKEESLKQEDTTSETLNENNQADKQEDTTSETLNENNQADKQKKSKDLEEKLLVK